MHKITRLTLMAATVSALAGAAWADAEPATPAQVAAELAAARASGEMAALVGEDSGSAWLSAQAGALPRTRAEVRAELLAARDSGLLEALHGEDSGSVLLSRQRAVEPLRLARSAG